MNDELPQQGFLEHLSELRGCLLRSAISIAVMSVVCFIFSQEIISVLLLPFKGAFEGKELIGTGPAEAFILRLKLGLFGGIVAATPWWTHEIWRFISPGLYEQEKKKVPLFVVGGSLGFIVGIVFCYYLILPFALSFFNEQYQLLQIAPTVRISEYFALIMRLMLVFGLVFEWPFIAFVLAKLELINSTQLKTHARYIIVGIFLAAAILTPPDVATQLLLAFPLMILYWLSIFVVKIVNK